MQITCGRCNITKEHTEFYVHKNSFTHDCKECRKAINKVINDKHNKQKYQERKEKALQYGISVKGIQYYGFQNTLNVYIRENRQCEICKSKENLVIHHKDESGTSNKNVKTNNSPDNLRLLCSPCHTRLHATGKTYKQKNPRPKIRVTLTCQICQKPFEVIPSRKDKAKYCSPECARIVNNNNLWKGGKNPLNNLF